MFPAGSSSGESSEVHEPERSLCDNVPSKDSDSDDDLMEFMQAKIRTFGEQDGQTKK